MVHCIWTCATQQWHFVFVTTLPTNWSIASCQEIFLSIPVEDKLATHEIDYISVSLNNTHDPYATQHNETKQHISNIRAAYYFHLAGKYLR